MRLCLILSFVLLALSATASEEEKDPYSLHLVRASIKMSSQGLHIAAVRKNIQRLGDGVAVAVLKIFPAKDLTSPETIRQFLPVIREAFSSPNLISNDEDKRPAVTLFLLDYLHQSVDDNHLRNEIVELKEFVVDKTSADKDSQ